MLGFPGGISMLEPEDLDAAWLEHTVSICRKRSRTAPARPVGCEEYFKLENNRVEILQHYRFRFFDDVLHTKKSAVRRFLPLWRLPRRKHPKSCLIRTPGILSFRQNTVPFLQSFIQTGAVIPFRFRIPDAPFALGKKDFRGSRRGFQGIPRLS